MPAGEKETGTNAMKKGNTGSIPFDQLGVLVCRVLLHPPCDMFRRKYAVESGAVKKWLPGVERKGRKGGGLTPCFRLSTSKASTVINRWDERHIEENT
jgi:hypothetical protein